MIARPLSAAAEQLGIEVSEIYIDTEEGMAEARMFGVTSVPTIIKETGDEIEVLNGFRTQTQLVEFLQG